MIINDLEIWHKIFLGALFKEIREVWIENSIASTGDTQDVKILNAFFNSEIFEERGTGNGDVITVLINEAEYLSKGDLSYESEGDKKLTSLRCVFDSISLSGNNTRRKPNYQHLSRMFPFDDAYIFPEAAVETDLERKYDEKWKKFYVELSRELGESLNIDLTSLYSLCKKHLWCIPSSSDPKQQDISLFEQARLTAALAVCIYHKIQEEKNNIEINSWPLEYLKDQSLDRFLLVCADFSGIQSFIYNIAHSGALKALKGRSFLLQQILDHIALDLIHRLELTDANLLYSNGGKFYVLVPNTERALVAIKEVGRIANETLLDLYGGENALLIAQIPLKGSDFVYGINNEIELPKIWDKLNSILSTESKYKKFEDIIDEDFFIVPERIRAFGSVELCYATGVELCNKDYSKSGDEKNTVDGRFVRIPVIGQSKNIYRINDQPGNIESPYLSEEQFIAQEIGRKLKNSKCIGTYLRSKDSYEDTHNSFKVAGDYYIKIYEDIKGGASRNTLLNSDDIINELDGLPAKCIKYYGGNWQLDDSMLYGADGEKLEGSFEYWKENAVGIPYLAVLRMDIDNLGKIFKNGLGKQATISRIVQLSAMLDFFFCGYLNKIRDLYWSPEVGISAQPTDTKLENSLQIVYSGGDDLFIVGRWDVIPDVAIWIRNEFKRYVGDHPDLSISAGISLFNAQQPLFKIAELAGEAEDLAKNYPGEVRVKDAICFLGNPMSWEDFQKVSSLAKTWFGYVSRGDPDGHRLPKAFLGLIQSIFAEFINDIFLKTKSTNIYEIMTSPKRALFRPALFGPWRWRAAYSLKRMGDRHKPFEKILHQLAFDLFLNNHSEKEYLFLMNTAAQWADYLTRKK